MNSMSESQGKVVSKKLLNFFGHVKFNLVKTAKKVLPNGHTFFAIIPERWLKILSEQIFYLCCSNGHEEHSFGNPAEKF